MKKVLAVILSLVLMMSVLPMGLFSITASALDATDNNQRGTVYTITYHLDGGTNALKNPDVYTFEDRITLMDAEKEGYTFDGWYLDEAKTQEIMDITNRTGNMDIYAKFMPKVYTATFDGNGAEECGYKVTLKNDKTGEEKYVYLNNGDSFCPHEYWKPSASGYVYAGWTYNSEVLSGTLKINSDIELVPKWIDNPNHYPVLGDDASVVSSQLYYLGDELNVKTAKFYTSYEYEDYTYQYVLQKYVCSCHSSSGNRALHVWSSCTIEQNYNDSQWTSIAYHAENSYIYENLGLHTKSGYGSFRAAPGTLLRTFVRVQEKSVHHYPQNPLNNVWIRIQPANKRKDIGKIEANNAVEFDTKVNAPTARKEGYTFLGWYDTQGNPMTDTWQYTEDQTFTAKWELLNYDIAYELDGGINNQSNPTVYTKEDTITLKDPTKPGYTFKGWYADANFKTQVTSISKKAGNITLYAKWEVNCYNLTLNANGGGFAPKITFISDGVEIKSCCLYDQDSITAYRPNNKEGYIFAGWYTDDTFTSLFKFNETITNDTTLYAKWVACDNNVINVESAGNFNVAIQGKTEQLYAFVPLVDGQITVTSESDHLDVYGILYNASKYVLISADDISSTDLDFSYTYSVKAGQRYYIAVRGATASTAGDAVVCVGWIGDCAITGTTYQNRQFSVVYGTNYQLPPKPIREGYVFLGWFDENDIQITDGMWGFVTDKTLTAKWEEATYHTVVFKDLDGNVISSETYYLSEDIVAPELPTKAPDNVYTYSAKWDNHYTGVCTGDAVYTPVFELIYKDYTVIFVDENGTELSKTTYHWGDTVTVPANPAKVADNTYTYTFIGWDKPVVANCAGNVTYTATYRSTYIDYTVRFVDEDGTIISEKSYHYGDKVDIPADPTKTANDTYTYTFAGWDKTVVDCVGDATYTATYTSAHINYTVVFKNWDGSVISTKTYHYGDKVTAPANPTRAADKTYSYTFAGWDKDIVANCTGDMTYTATYTSAYIDYTVRFVDEDGTIIFEKSYHYGDKVDIPADPTKTADNACTYTFAGWDKTVVDCVGDATYTATYTSVHINYTVVFKNWDGSVISTKTYHYGDEVAVPADPTKAADNTYTYAFDGWDSDVTECMGDATYTATYTPVYIDYTVVFRRWNGSVISTKTYHYGDKVTAPPNPTRVADNTYSYTFNGWDNDVTDCIGNAVYTATYTAVYIDYTVVFKNWDGSVISTKTYHYGDKVAVPADPTKAADNTHTYTFAGWNKEVVACAGDATYTAKYTPVYIDYTVVFKNWDGSVISTRTYHYGNYVIAPICPNRAEDNTYSYTFNGWDSDVTNCMGNAVYTATYTAAYIDYTVVFENWDGSTISRQTYHYGDKVDVPADPAKASNDTYTYTFAGWDKMVVNCAGDTVYTATYTEELREYTVEFKNWNGELLSTETYHWGDTVIVPQSPTRAADSVYEYVFAGWDKDITSVYRNVTYTATYIANLRRNGWTQEDGKWYFYENGTMVTSAWRKDSKGWVYLGADGAMLTNQWCTDSKGWCYVGADGYAVTNCWKKDSKGWIWLDANGSMTKSKWILDGGKWYYVDASGYMVTNKWMKDSKGWVKLGANGAMLTNQWTTDSKGWCYVGADGYAVTNCWKKDNTGWIWLDANGSMTKSQWIPDGDKWYYCDANGYMVANKTITISGKKYTFNASGVWVA